jgi:hypothetical protein
MVIGTYVEVVPSVPTTDGGHRVTMYRSPGGPPFTPGSPLPWSRMREPVSTPPGILTAMRSVPNVAPRPPQVRHASRPILPFPRQRGHASEVRRRPRPARRPFPPQSGQASSGLPGLAPDPRQASHWECLAR